mmetsp:Transcript_80486/g.167705  ORF Transcript_80486/g.167705 Transcript_80486/m.167705 type:complete len:217 (+) Transcript_80486:535-1185(+)
MEENRGLTAIAMCVHPEIPAPQALRSVAEELVTLEAGAVVAIEDRNPVAPPRRKAGGDCDGGAARDAIASLLPRASPVHGVHGGADAWSGPRSQRRGVGSRSIGELCERSHSLAPLLLFVPSHDPQVQSGVLQLKAEARICPPEILHVADPKAALAIDPFRGGSEVREVLEAVLVDHKILDLRGCPSQHQQRTPVNDDVLELLLPSLICNFEFLPA